MTSSKSKSAAAYIALLRGVNVGGNTLKMDRLREIWVRLGFKNVRTYVQSGNVVFDAAGIPSDWSAKVDRQLAGESRLPVTVIFRNAAELEKIIARNPFVKNAAIDRSKLHVTFLAQPAASAAAKNLDAIKAGADEFRILGHEIYLHCPGGYGGTKLSNNAIEKCLGVRATTRNWNTVNQLHEMACELSG